MIFRIRPILWPALLFVCTSWAAASASPLTYDFTATAAAPALSGNLNSVVPLYIGLMAGSTVTGSVTYDPSTPLAFTQNNSGSTTAAYVTGSWLLNLPAGTIGGPLTSLGFGITVRNQKDAIPDFYDIQQSLFGSVNADLIFSLPSASTNLTLPSGLNLSPTETASITITDVVNCGPCDLNASEFLQFELTSLSPAVPEPSTWAMMILGFLGVGFAACRRRTTMRFA